MYPISKIEVRYRDIPHTPCPKLPAVKCLLCLASFTTFLQLINLHGHITIPYQSPRACFADLDKSVMKWVSHYNITQESVS